MILRFENPHDFEKHIATILERDGFHVEFPPQNQRGYDLKATKGNRIIAVQVKNLKVKVNVSMIERFSDFLETPYGSEFTEGWFVSASGYSRPALTHLNSECPNNIVASTFIHDKLVQNYPGNEVPPEAEEDEKITYIGVFTCKGGVGKTTVAAHLGGAFALMGYDVILLDLDPDKNLRKLFLQGDGTDDEDASIYVPGTAKQEGRTITVLYHTEWDEKQYQDIKLVICDCSPVLSENPSSLVEKFDYCIIPTTLNPLGVSKNGDVIIRTFEHIREMNSKADMFALINAYNAAKAQEPRNKVLFSYLKNNLTNYLSKDRKCKLISPEAAKIRRSDTLHFWGYHLIEGTKPQLAFRNIAGRNYPRIDFLQLAEYLESHTDIDQLLGTS